MASRDLTKKFVDFRAARPRRARAGSGGAARPGGAYEDRSLVGGYASDASDMEHGAAAAAAAGLPPVWVDLVEGVEREVGKIEANIRQLRELHTKRLMVRFDDANEAALDREIEAKTREATRLFRACEQALKRVNADESAEHSERIIRGNIQRSVAIKIQALNTDFRKTQKEYLARLKTQKGGDSTFDFLSGESEPRPAEGAAFNEAQMAAVVDVENLVEERDAEIRKIAESIQELSTIFKELAVLVIDQGTVLDRIDFNMEMVAEHTRKGVAEIEKAEQYQKAARPRICIALLLFLISIMMVALILKHRDKGDKDKKKK